MNPKPTVRNVAVHGMVDGQDVHFLFREEEGQPLALYGAHPALPLATSDMPEHELDDLRAQVLAVFRRLLPLTVSQ